MADIDEDRHSLAMRAGHPARDHGGGVQSLTAVSGGAQASLAATNSASIAGNTTRLLPCSRGKRRLTDLL